MESLTFELCTNPSDPLDRTLCILAKSGKELLACRAWRLLDAVTVDDIVKTMATLTLRWAAPHLGDPDGFGELLDEIEQFLTQPF